MNTLSQRLKYAKRELTALKTAHFRGIGLVKVFSREVHVDLSPYVGELGYIRITVDFDNSYVPYPLAQIIPKVTSSGIIVFSDALEIFYLNNGYSLRTRLTWAYSGSGISDFYVEALSPIADINYTIEVTPQ